jgi:putative transposase
MKTHQQESNERLLEAIRAIYNQSHGRYGSPRITAALHAQGYTCSKNRVARLMRQAGIKDKTKRRFKVTTHANKTKEASPNLVAQNFTAQTANQLWCSDITYLWTREGWLYLAVVFDVFSRRIVGYALSARLTADLVEDALQRALHSRTVRAGLMFHSDRGSQYASASVRAILGQYHLRQSMSSTGCCYDNAISETFFHTPKTELTFWECYETRQEAISSIFEYIEIFYNRQRIHSALGYLSPVDFEKLHH